MQASREGMILSRKIPLIVVTWLALGATVLYVFRIGVGGQMMMETAFMAYLLGLFLPLAFILYPAHKGVAGNKVPWYDILLAVLSTLGPALVFIYAVPLTESVWSLRPPPVVMALGIITWVLIIEAARRVTGWIFAAIAGVISLYPLVASLMPSVLFAKSYTLSRLVGFHLLGGQSIFGIPMQFFGSLLVGFMVFGVALEATGAAKFLLDTAQGLLGRQRGGPALVAVLASALMASLSGSAVANVVATGTVTIPAMKKLGYPSHMAGAIEACASNGGPLTPPVMGAAAFIMAAFLQVPYAWVCVAAFLPMLIYYVGVGMQVYLYAQRRQIPSLEASQIPSLRKTFKEGWFYLGSIVVLVYLLFWIKVEAWAPYYAIIFLVLCSFIRKETRPNLRTLERFTIETGQLLVFLAPVMAAVGLVIGSTFLTGVAQSLSSELVILAGGNLYLLLVMGALGAFVLGMGLPMTPVYIFTALMFAPSLIQMGVPPISAHLFFLYWAMISFITPPVCTTVYAAAAIANAPVMRTGFTTMKLAITIYIVPFAFVLNPALVAQGSVPQVILSVLAAIVGTVLIAFALEGYLVRLGSIRAAARAAMFFPGVILLFAPVMIW